MKGASTKTGTGVGVGVGVGVGGSTSTGATPSQLKNRDQGTLSDRVGKEGGTVVGVKEALREWTKSGGDGLKWRWLDANYLSSLSQVPTHPLDLSLSFTIHSRTPLVLYHPRLLYNFSYSYYRTLLTHY